MFIAASVIIGLAHLTMAVLFTGVIRRRHDSSIHPVFWAAGAYWLMLSCLWLQHVAAVWFPVLRQGVLWFTLFAAVAGLTATVWLVWYTPRAMRVPSVKEIASLCAALRSEVLSLQNRACELEHSDALALRKQLNAALTELRRLTGDSTDSAAGQ